MKKILSSIIIGTCIYGTSYIYIAIDNYSGFLPKIENKQKYIKK